MKTVLYTTLLIGSFGLSGCAVTTSKDGKTSVSAVRDRLESLDVKDKTIPQKLTLYENQLITRGQPYATIQSYPFIDFRTAFKPPHPVTVFSIDGKNLKRIPFSWSKQVTSFDMSVAKLKIPAGKHTIMVNGLSRGARQYFTKLPAMTFQAGKKYLLKPIFSGKKNQLAIYSFTEDSRFSKYDKDRYVIGRQITAPVDIANEKEIFNW